MNQEHVISVQEMQEPLHENSSYNIYIELGEMAHHIMKYHILYH